MMEGVVQMPTELPKCKITVLKRTINRDLMDEYLDDAYKDTGLCECFEEGDEFIIDPTVVPEAFLARCAWAWADIRQDIMTIAMGANIPGIRQPGTVITGCTDWLRPVIFKVERMDQDET
jgi:uncharacterized repeat protein (TIGR04076 family)